jgi:hypothetical protein
VLPDVSSSWCVLPDVSSSVVLQKLSVQKVHQSSGGQSPCKQMDRQGTFLANFRCRGAQKPAQLSCGIFGTDGFEVNLFRIKCIVAISLSYHNVRNFVMVQL